VAPGCNQTSVTLIPRAGDPQGSPGSSELLHIMVEEMKNLTPSLR
jgi:hypothetical protein